MPSRRVLLVAIAVGVALVGGSAVLDATTPDVSYTYEARELSPSLEDSTEAVVDDTTVDPAGPSAVFVDSSGPGDRPERTALREAANDSRTKVGLPDSIVDHEYVVVGTSDTFSDVRAVYRLHEHEDGGAVRVTAERISVATFYDELAVSAASDARLRELARTGQLTTHDRITAVLVADDGQYYHVMQPPESTRYTGVETDLYGAGYLLGISIVLFAGGYSVVD